MAKGRSDSDWTLFRTTIWHLSSAMPLDAILAVWCGRLRSLGCWTMMTRRILELSVTLGSGRWAHQHALGRGRLQCGQRLRGRPDTTSSSLKSSSSSSISPSPSKSSVASILISCCWIEKEDRSVAVVDDSILCATAVGARLRYGQQPSLILSVNCVRIVFSQSELFLFSLSVHVQYRRHRHKNFSRNREYRGSRHCSSQSIESLFSWNS